VQDCKDPGSDTRPVASQDLDTSNNGRIRMDQAQVASAAAKVMVAAAGWGPEGSSNRMDPRYSQTLGT